MQSFNSDPLEKDGAIRSMVRGLIAGLIGVSALAIWAVNFEAILHHDQKESYFLLVLRILFCEAIPIATLISIYASVTRHKSLEEIVHSIVRTIFWFWKPSTGTMKDELDSFAPLDSSKLP